MLNYLLFLFSFHRNISSNKKLAYKSYDKLWRIDFYKHVSTQDRPQYTNRNPLKVKVSDIYKKNEKSTTQFQPCKDEDVLNKAQVAARVSKVEGYISFIYTKILKLNYVAVILKI